LTADGDRTIDPEGSVPGTAGGEYQPGGGEGLRPGVARSHEFEVNDRLLTDVGGTIGVRVLSTPGMIAMMERNAAILSFEYLPDGKATVGFEVCVKHVAAAAEGARCIAHARVREVVEARKLHFDVEVREGDRVIGVGTHQRRVIDIGGLATADE
jgi:fluoroacetyl-CoA thioesterase